MSKQTVGTDEVDKILEVFENDVAHLHRYNTLEQQQSMRWNFYNDAKLKLEALIRKEVREAEKRGELKGRILQIQMMDGIATDNIEMWLKNCLTNAKTELAHLKSLEANQ